MTPPTHQCPQLQPQSTASECSKPSLLTHNWIVLLRNLLNWPISQHLHAQSWPPSNSWLLCFPSQGLPGNKMSFSYPVEGRYMYKNTCAWKRNATKHRCIKEKGTPWQESIPWPLHSGSSGTVNVRQHRVPCKVTELNWRLESRPQAWGKFSVLPSLYLGWQISKIFSASTEQDFYRWVCSEALFAVGLQASL